MAQSPAIRALIRKLEIECSDLKTENDRLTKSIDRLPSLPTMPDNENDTGFVGCEVQIQTVLQAVDEIKSLSRMFWDLKRQNKELRTALEVIANTFAPDNRIALDSIKALARALIAKHKAEKEESK